MAKKTKSESENPLGEFTKDDVEKLGFIAKRAAGLPLDHWDVEWWIRDNYDVNRIEFIRDHQEGQVFAIELGDGQFYRALWVDGADPPDLILDKAGPGTKYSAIPEIVEKSRAIPVKAKN